jgi:hypothetical protein
LALRRLLKAFVAHAPTLPNDPDEELIFTLALHLERSEFLAVMRHIVAAELLPPETIARALDALGPAHWGDL